MQVQFYSLQTAKPSMKCMNGIPQTWELASSLPYRCEHLVRQVVLSVDGQARVAAELVWVVCAVGQALAAAAAGARAVLCNIHADYVGHGLALAAAAGTSSPVHHCAVTCLCTASRPPRSGRKLSTAPARPGHCRRHVYPRSRYATHRFHSPQMCCNHQFNRPDA